MFTYFKSAIGAWLLHVSTSSFLYQNGRVLGCSSILYNSVFNPTVFNVPVLVGIAIGTAFVYTSAPGYLPDYQSVASIAPFGPWTPFIAGLLCGVGTKWGSGCTSGHMLCGIARGSVRSLVATCVFSSMAIITSYLSGSAPSCEEGLPCHTLQQPNSGEIMPLLGLAIGSYAISHLLRRYLKPSRISQILTSILSGFCFSLGLLISGLASPAKTLGFLALVPPKFDPSLLMVVVFGIIPNFIEFHAKNPNTCKPAAVPSFELPKATQVTLKLVIGSAIFGIGWGLSGICPGPGIISGFLNGYQGLSWLTGFFLTYRISPNNIFK